MLLKWFICDAGGQFVRVWRDGLESWQQGEVMPVAAFYSMRRLIDMHGFTFREVETKPNPDFRPRSLGRREH